MSKIYYERCQVSSDENEREIFKTKTEIPDLVSHLSEVALKVTSFFNMIYTPSHRNKL